MKNFNWLSIFKAYGLDWQPSVGDYVLDQSEMINKSSPFRTESTLSSTWTCSFGRAGSLEMLKDRVCWLPDWHQARQILRKLGLSTQETIQHLIQSGAFEKCSERTELYRLIRNQNHQRLAPQQKPEHFRPFFPVPRPCPGTQGIAGSAYRPFTSWLEAGRQEPPLQAFPDRSPTP